MAVTPFQLPMVQQGVPFVDLKTGALTGYASDWLNRILKQITDQVNVIDNNIAGLQAAQAQIQAVQQQLLAVIAAQNPPTGQHGSVTGTASTVGSGWSSLTVIHLTGVAAGNLTYPGSGPSQIDGTVVNPSGPVGDFVGDWRIVEIVSAVETVVFTGTYAAGRHRDDGALPFASTVDNASATTGSVARTSTGAVDYRIDIRAIGFEVDDVQLALYVARS